MGLNAQIGGEVDVHNPATIDLVYEKAIEQEKMLKSISNYHENNHKNFNWSQANQASKKPTEGQISKGKGQRIS